MRITDLLKLISITLIFFSCKNLIIEKDSIIEEEEFLQIPTCIIDNPIEEQSYCTQIIEDTCTNIKNFTSWNTTFISTSNCNSLGYINLWNNCQEYLMSTDQEKVFQDYCNTNWYYAP